MPDQAPITAVFPVVDRSDEAIKTLQALYGCDPVPQQIIVYVDGGSAETITAIRSRFAEVDILFGRDRCGPGGARNQLVRAARHEMVASFDDDSRPNDPGFFARVLETAGKFPEAAVLSAASQMSESSIPDFLRLACPSGCGCVFRKGWFLRTSGFVPLQVAFNMEETDIGLQLQEIGGMVVHDPKLRVLHEHPQPRALTGEESALVLANTVLLPFLRYPIVLLPLALGHLVSQIRNYVHRGWAGDIIPGLRLIPGHLWKNRHYRMPVSTRAVLDWLRLRRRPDSIGKA